MHAMIKWISITILTTLILAAIIGCIGTFANIKGARAYLTREVAYKDQSDNDGAIINEAPVTNIINADGGLLCTHSDNNSMCSRDRGEAPFSPVNVSVPVKVTIPINNTNNDINHNNNNIKNNDTVTSGTQAIPNNNNITVTIPPVGTTSQQIVPNIGTLFVRTTLPNVGGYCVSGQFHVVSNIGPVCLSVSLMK